jgi:hypothetical protein
MTHAVSTRYVSVIYAHRCRVFLRERCPGKRHYNYCQRRTAELDEQKPRVEELRKFLGKERVPPRRQRGRPIRVGNGSSVPPYPNFKNPRNTIREERWLGSRRSQDRVPATFLFLLSRWRSDDNDRRLALRNRSATHRCRCGLYRDRLDFLRLTLGANTKPCMIEVPKLTYKEIRHLDRQLPRAKRRKLTVPKVPPADIKRYENIYRYFPTFAETEV